METTTRSQRMNKDIAALLKARHTLLWVVTQEEVRVERALVDAAGAAGYVTQFWDCVAGLTDATGETLDGQLQDPSAMIRSIGTTKDKRVIFVLRDLHRWFDPLVLRGLRSLARSLQSAPRQSARAVVLLTPSREIPPDLAGHAVVLEYPLPDRLEIGEILDGVMSALPEEVASAAKLNGGREAAIDAAVGLSAEEAANCYAKSLVTTKSIDPLIVGKEKQRVIARERVLTWYEPDARGLAAVGGLGVLKDWLTQRALALSQKARDFGLPAPKGVLLVGVPGCGKSLTAKAVAAAWGVPLLRLDLGALKSKWVGESEANVRKALAVAETVSPCVLWLDEIEKALSGATSGAADGGVSADALGAVLSWLQEKEGSVFVVATANDVSKLPPELLRKGRFDELFFVDLPTRSERRDILMTALRQFKQDPETILIDAVAGETGAFTGAELAALIPDAMFAAFADQSRGLTTADLLDAAKNVVPLSSTAADKLSALRTWAKGRARPASRPDAADAATPARTIDI